VRNHLWGEMTFKAKCSKLDKLGFCRSAEFEIHADVRGGIDPEDEVAVAQFFGLRKVDLVPATGETFQVLANGKTVKEPEWVDPPTIGAVDRALKKKFKK
jgi:hypothetical protein